MLLQELSQSLAQDRSSANLSKWAYRLAEERFPLLELAPALEKADKVSLRMTWMLGELTELCPSCMQPALSHFWQYRDKLPIKGLHRSLGKWLLLAGIPPEIEGEVIDTLFTWAMDPQEEVSSKRFALLNLLKACKKYPDLTPELRLVMLEQKELNTANFKKQVDKMLLSLPRGD